MTGRKELDTITEGIIGAAIDVHRELGPGLLESAYEHCLAFELSERGYFVERQKLVPVKYKKEIIIELKAVESIAPIHRTQLMTYLKLTGLKVGLLMNFNVRILKHGLHRVVNNF